MSAIRPDLDRHEGPAVVMHWLMAVLLLGLAAVGLYMTGLPFSPQRLKLFNWHKWAGIVVLALACTRLAWRLAHPNARRRASVEASMPRWQRWAYRSVHVALYVLFFAIPLLGWAYSSASGFPVVVFGVLALPDLAPADKVLADALKQAHHFSAYALMMLVALHVGAALKHQFIDRTPLLRLMWFGSPRDPTSREHP